MSDARTDFLDARLRLVHELAAECGTPDELVAALSMTFEELVIDLATDPVEPISGSLRARHAATLRRNDQLERDYEHSQKRLAAATSDQLAMVLHLDRLRHKIKSTLPPQGMLCEDR